MMEKAMLDKLLEQEMLIKELKEENFVLVSQLNIEQHYDNYKDRIDKAIEYLEEHKNLIVLMGTNYYKLLDILKGE